MTTYGKHSARSSQNSVRSPQLRRKAPDPSSQAVRARKENCPPLPGLSAPPYVLCQGCGMVVQIHVQHYFEGLLKMGRATSSMQRSDNSGSFDTQKLLSTVATGGTIAQNSAVQEVESAKLNEDNKSSCVLNGQHDGQHKQFEANATPVGVQNFDNFMPKMAVEQGPYEDENSLNPWSRSGTFHEDSSSLFSVSGSVSTKNTAGLKSHESQQLETYVELVSDCLPPEESVQAKDPSIEANSTFEQQTASGPIVSSKELQGLMLECLQQNPSDEVKLNRKESFTLKRNQFHQDKCNEPVRLSNDTSSSPSEQIGCQNQDLGHGEAEVSNNGANFNVNGPAPGHGNNKNASVVVNGTIITLDAIKRAEKQAGAIRPGVYWYDYEAGFWGVLGGPCLGIIPPFIAEFKSTLVQSCAGGTTDVFVNGRELHRKDLDALAGRGLPRIPGKSYMVNISGQVVDKSSGQMLRSLGRLAPTVEKRGRGCGMFQPPTLS
ncbi:hypothetical protein L7F22_040804 [Adiantum nelumboides]|nr:hypothetical protein [Adiantum nelumboides]